MRTVILFSAALLFVTPAEADTLAEQIATLGTVQGARSPASPRQRRTLDEPQRVRRQGKERAGHARHEQDELAAVLAEATGNDGEQVMALLRSPGDDESAPVDRSRSHGSARGGSLEGAVQVPDHAGYIVRDRSRAWGTPGVVAALVRAFDEVLAQDPRVPPVRVHDVSLRYGGPMDGHKSHQNGRDLDMTYYQHGCGDHCRGHRVAQDELDAERQWRLLRHWLERDLVEFIFVDYSLQGPLHEAALAGGATARQLAQWFQYPRGPASPSGIVRHVPNHANHVHVRFRCGESDNQCKRSRTRRDSRDGEEVRGQLDDESELLELLAE